MSLVERLVSRWHKEYTGKSEREEARWWLNAIADELDNHTFGFQGSDELTYTMGVRKGMGLPIEWLRSQANPDSAEEK